MAKVKVNKAKMNKKPSKKTKVKVKVERKPKILGLSPSEHRWEAFSQKVSEKSEVIQDYLELIKDKAKEKIHDVSFKVASYVEKDEYGSSKFSQQMASIKSKFQQIKSSLSSTSKKVDPLEIQRFEGEGGRVRGSRKSSQELE